MVQYDIVSRICKMGNRYYIPIKKGTIPLGHTVKIIDIEDVIEQAI